MQRGREERSDLFDKGDPFSVFHGFGGFGTHRSMITSMFGERDPFDDPFFTRPFGSMFDQSSSSGNIALTNNSKGIVIEELTSDHEGGKEGKCPGDFEMDSGSSKEPSVEHPDDDVEDGNNEDVYYKTQHSKVKWARPQAHSFSFQTCKVTYGGVDGAYYTSSRTRRTSNDGVVLEESKEADRTTGQASHRISRGINDKGHSLTRKLTSDGKVDSRQTLHNLNEDELTGFEKAWKGNANKHLPNWREGFDMNRNAVLHICNAHVGSSRGGRALPSSEQTRTGVTTTSDNVARANASWGRTKKVVRINIRLIPDPLYLLIFVIGFVVSIGILVI